MIGCAQIAQFESTATAPAVPPPKMTQLECLMTLYKEWNVPGWGKADVALGTWRGVTVDKANKVVKLDLTACGLKGTKCHLPISVEYASVLLLYHQIECCST